MDSARAAEIVAAMGLTDHVRELAANALPLSDAQVRYVRDILRNPKGDG